MSIEISNSGGVVIIKPLDRLDAANAPDFDAQATEAIGTDSAKVMVDLSGLEYISSAGLRCMLLLAKKLRRSKAIKLRMNRSKTSSSKV